MPAVSEEALAFVVQIAAGAGSSSGDFVAYIRACGQQAYDAGRSDNLVRYAVRAAELGRPTPSPRAAALSGADLRSLVVRAEVGSSRVDLQACKLEYSIVSPK